MAYSNFDKLAAENGIAIGAPGSETTVIDSSRNVTLQSDAVGDAELNTEIKEVTVTAGGSTGTATVTAGNVILGYYPTSNQDQFVDSIAISSTTLTVTLAANATADNVFKVVMLKA